MKASVISKMRSQLFGSIISGSKNRILESHLYCCSISNNRFKDLHTFRIHELSRTIFLVLATLCELLSNG